MHFQVYEKPGEKAEFISESLSLLLQIQERYVLNGAVTTLKRLNPEHFHLVVIYA